MSDDNSLRKQVKRLMRQGIHDPHELFKRVYNTNRVHYSRVREAVHSVKSD
jgi:hypothetical protein